MRRAAVVLCVAAGIGASSAAEAGAVTLRLVFPDGQPMTYGSACVGTGCLARGAGEPVDARGEVELPGALRTIEYRREGIILALAPVGVASGTILPVASPTIVVLPRLLVGSSPGIDAAESDLVARLNEVRAAQGLPLAQINPRLSAAADLQATWLVQSGATLMQADRFHEGPFGTGPAFRQGEVSLPNPGVGGEVAAAGGTIDETVSDWLSSAEHRKQVLAPGPLLLGAAQVGGFYIVQTHRPCSGCEQIGTGSRLGTAPPPLAVAASVPVAPLAAPTTASSAPVAPQPSCGREQLATRLVQVRRGLARLRVGTQCLRPGSRYVLMVRQGTNGRVLRTVRIWRAGTITLTLRPGRTVTRLRVKLKRDGRAIFARSLSLRRF